MTSASDDEANVATPMEGEVKAMPPSAPAPAGWSLLRRGDQTAIAMLLVVALLWSVVGWFRSGGATRHLVDADTRLAENPARQPASFLVDINTADVAELGELPQVGPTLARRLIEHRAKHGPFRSFDDLLRVQGIGPKTLDALRPHVRFE